MGDLTEPTTPSAWGLGLVSQHYVLASAHEGRFHIESQDENISNLIVGPLG